MADRHVEQAVARRLEELGVELDPYAHGSLSKRIAGAEALPDDAEGDDEALRVALETQQAKISATELAAALRRREPTGKSGYSEKDLSVALKGICPLWPFC